MPMTSDPEARERSLAALAESRTTWQPGQSGNPSGAKTAGTSYKEYLNALAGKDKAYIAVIAKDKHAPAVQRMAAKTLLRGLRDGYCKAVPLAANDLDRISDRTDGKPHQSLHVTKTTIRPPAVIGVDKGPLLLQAYASLPPAQRAVALAQMQAFEAPELPPVDVESVEVEGTSDSEKG